MKKDKSWDKYIQRICVPQEIYLYMKKPLVMLQNNKNKILKLSRNTLFFDSTGSVVKKFDDDSKRVYLYALVAHIHEKDETGILLPIAEALLCSHYSKDIKRFLFSLYTYCVENKLKWPIAKRICIDWSWASINAIIRVFNKLNKIQNIDQYLSACYTYVLIKVRIKNRHVK